MRKTFLAIAAAAVLASSSAFAGTIICQPLGDATVCSNGTTAMPLGDGAYVLKDEPRDKWGSREHPQPGNKDDYHDH